jgi:hypothetical protein
MYCTYKLLDIYTYFKRCWIFFAPNSPKKLKAKLFFLCVAVAALFFCMISCYVTEKGPGSSNVDGKRR